MIVCAVPVKDLVNAKQRLVPALEPTERRELARAMLSDVLAALRAARLDGVWVVTRDPEVVGLAAAFGAEPLASLGPVENSSHTSAVAFAHAEDAPEDVAALATAGGTTESARVVRAWASVGARSARLRPP